MIITRTPLRISFVGGGSDRDEFLKAGNIGACVSAAIDKYVYVTLSNKYDGNFRVAYSKTQDAKKLSEIQHELVRECLALTGIEGVEIHSIADIPGGTGLGSSSSFTVGLLAALDCHDFTKNAAPQWLARTACRIEIDKCKKAIGRQDQYAAAFGGLNSYRFLPSNRVEVHPIECDYQTLSNHCLLLDTGLRRNDDAGVVLERQNHDMDAIRTLRNFVSPFEGALLDNDMEACGVILDLCWQVKRRFVMDSAIDAWYNAAREYGAWGGKLCGAGGGGFLLFMAPPRHHDTIASVLGLRIVPIKIGSEGSRVVYRS